MPVERAKSRRPILRRAVAAALAGVALATLPMAGQAFAAPAYTLDERAAAIASPALVYLEGQFEGYLRVRGTNALVEPDKILFSRPCSGFVVNSGGYAVTTAHCLQPSPDSLRMSAASQVASDMIKSKKLADTDRAGYVNQLMGTTDFTGADPGSPPVTKIYAQLYGASGGLTTAPAIETRLVDSRPAPGPDLALVKIAGTGLPVVKVDTEQPRLNTHVLQLAFGTDDVTATPVAYTVRSKPATIVGQYGNKTPPLYKMDGELGGYAYGGMAVSSSGKVVGIIDAGGASENRADELIAGISVIGDMLAKAGAKNDLGPSDTAYQAGLDAYYSGRYGQAVKNFDKVLAAQPNNKVADGFRKQAQQRLAIEGDGSESGTPAWLLLTLAGLGGILVATATMTAILLARRRRRQPVQDVWRDPYARDPYAQDPFAPGPVPPVSVPPISAEPLSAYPVSASPYPAYPQETAPAFPPAEAAAPPPQPDPFANPFPGGFMTQSPAVAGEGPTMAVPPPMEPPSFAGVPTPVSPPHGIPVAHPTWEAAAPRRLPGIPGIPEPATEPPIEQNPSAPAAQGPAAQGPAAQGPAAPGENEPPAGTGDGPEQATARQAAPLDPWAPPPPGWPPRGDPPA